MHKETKRADRLHKSTAARKRRRNLKDMLFETAVNRFAILRKKRKKRK